MCALAHSLVGVTRGNVKTALGKQLSPNTVERPRHTVRGVGGTMPLGLRVHRVIAHKWHMISLQ